MFGRDKDKPQVKVIKKKDVVPGKVYQGRRRLPSDPPRDPNAPRVVGRPKPGASRPDNA